MAIITTFLILFLMVPTLFLGFETIAAFLYCKKNKYLKQTMHVDPSYVVLIPAHNEEKEIASTLSALLSQVNAPSQILVVADNCIDQTAQIAEQCGATVVERFNEKQRGKGYALDFGIEYIEANICPDELIILDADCIVSRGSIKFLANLSFISERPVQTVNLCSVPETGGMQLRIAAFAMLFKNFIRPLGLKMLDRPCLLCGTGMAFPWSLVKQLDFATENIVEDMQLGIDCVRLGSPPLFCEDVLIESPFPVEQTAEKTQRIRWEHGHLKTLLIEVPKLMNDAVKDKNSDLLLLALEIGVPPLSLLVILQVIVGAVTMGGGIIFDSSCLIILSCLPVTVLTAVILFGWLSFGKEILPLRYLVIIPWYIIKKIPVYLKFLFKPEKKWVRTSRK